MIGLFLGDTHFSDVVLNKIIKLRRKWDIQKNTEAVEKWAQKKEEPGKRIRRNKIYFDEIYFYFFAL